MPEEKESSKGKKNVPEETNESWKQFLAFGSAFLQTPPELAKKEKKKSERGKPKK